MTAPVGAAREEQAERCAACRAGLACARPTRCPPFTFVRDPKPTAEGEPTRLVVQTARVGYAGPDGLDVTWKSAAPAARVFAPSWSILGPALEARTRAVSVRAGGAGLMTPAVEADAQAILAAAWATYELAYRAEMRVCYGVPRVRWGPLELAAHHRGGVRPRRAAWEALLRRPAAVLLCYCAPEAGPRGEAVLRCHRRLLAGILVALGAEDRGEVEST